MSYPDYDDDDNKPQESFLKRNRVKMIVGVAFVAVIGTVAILVKVYTKIPAPRKPQEIVIHLQPLPPQPPPPPPPPHLRARPSKNLSSSPRTSSRWKKRTTRKILTSPPARP